MMPPPPKGGGGSIPLKQQIGNKQKFMIFMILQENSQLQNDKILNSPLSEDHVTHQQSPQRPEADGQEVCANIGHMLEI
jgi:hypothetical protein